MNRTDTTTAALVAVPTVHGTFEAALTERGVRCLLFPNQTGAAQRWLGRHLSPPHAPGGQGGQVAFAAGVPVRTADALAALLASELDAYFRGELTAFTVPVDLAGTPFQRGVWAELRAIPYGEVRSYADVARAIGRPEAVRAVGAANGANPVPIIVPCHRVIGSSGALTGFGGGLDWKRRLLATENAARWGELPLLP